MKIKTYILSFVLLVLLPATQCIAKYNVGELDSDYQKSCSEFQSTRQGSSVEKYAKKMADGLTDIGSVVERLATDDEKRVIYKSFFGTAIALGFGVETPQQIFDEYYESKRATLESSKYAANFKFLKAVNTLSHGLVKQFKEGSFSNLSWRSQINEQSHNVYETILTSNFISWFCESLAEYYTEFSFVSDREWFAEVQKQVQKGNYVEREVTTRGNMRHYWVFNEARDGVIGVYKEASVETKSYQVEAEAKQIPHRVLGLNGVVISETYNYPSNCHTRADGSKFILVTNTREVRKDLSNRFLTNLVAGVMDFSDVVSREIPVRVKLQGKDKSVQLDPTNYTGLLEKFLGSFERDVPSENSGINNLVRSIYKTQSEKSEDQSGCHVIHQSDVYNALLNNFNEGQVQAFAQESTLSVQDLFKVLAFAKITNNRDSHSNNIVFMWVNGGFKPILIDHEYTWEGTQKVPMFYELDQAGKTLKSAWMQRILSVLQHSREKFHHIFGAFGERMQREESGFFERFEKLRSFCLVDQTLRAITHELYTYKDGSSYNPDMYIAPVLAELGGGRVSHPQDMFSTLNKWIYSMNKAEYEKWLNVLNGTWQRSINDKSTPVWRKSEKPGRRVFT